jgi:aspartate 1-decarboxylase
LDLIMLKGKIHRARITAADVNYEGSIEVDSSLLEAAGIIPFERVDIWSITSGERFSTYALPAPRGSGIVAVNGAAARKAQPGDEIIIAAFAQVSAKEAEGWKPKVVFVDEKNRLRPLPKIARPLIHNPSTGHN